MHAKEVLKNQVKFKSDLKEIKIRSNESEAEKNTVRKITFFNLLEKLLNFLRIIFFCYLKLNTNQSMEKVSKYPKNS